MLRKAATWLSTLKGVPMKKQMVGDVVVTVIDEIGEVTYCHDAMQKDVYCCSDRESEIRTMAAVLELIEVAEQLCGVSQVGAKLTSAKELLLVNFEWHVDRLSERNEFKRDVRRG